MCKRSLKYLLLCQFIYKYTKQNGIEKEIPKPAFPACIREGHRNAWPCLHMVHLDTCISLV